MKIRHLAEVDLANLTALAAEEQRRRMFRLARGGGIFSFDPTRSQFADITNVQPEMFISLGEAPITPFRMVEKELRRRCKPGLELEANLLVARQLYNYFRSRKAVSRAYNFIPFALGLGRSVQYWVSAYYAQDDLPVITFIDPRGGKHLTRMGRDVVFSVMHEAIRERHPDFTNAILEIVQLPYSDDQNTIFGHKGRDLRIYRLDEKSAYSVEQLDEMLTRTITLWDIVCAAIVEEDRKRGGGGSGH